MMPFLLWVRSCMQQSVSSGLKNGRQRGIFSLLATVTLACCQPSLLPGHAAHICLDTYHFQTSMIFPEAKGRNVLLSKDHPLVHQIPAFFHFQNMGATVTFSIHRTPSPISTTFQLLLSKNIPDVAKQQNSHESMSGWQMGASISRRRESLTSITHHFLLELVLAEYFENPRQHVKISKQNFFFKSLELWLISVAFESELQNLH